MKKIWIIGIVALLVVAGVYYMTNQAWDEGSPTGTITAILRETTTGNEWTATMDIDDIESQTATMTPSTIYNADIQALNPNGLYEIFFRVTATFDTDGNAKCEQTGILNNGKATLRDAVQDHTKISEEKSTLMGTQTTYTFDDGSGGVFRWGYYWDGTNPIQIRGSMIDGASFDFLISGTGYNSDGAWSTGSTTFTVNIIEGTQGTINITIDDIQTDVTIRN